MHVDVEVDTPAELVAFDASFWARYALTVLWGQARVVWPIALYMMLFKSAVLQLPAPRDLSHVVWAVNAVVVGLGLFLEGLKFGLMPLSEAVGKTLPVKVPLPTTLAVALVLGVGVTFAEPAIGALSPCCTALLQPLAAARPDNRSIHSGDALHCAVRRLQSLCARRAAAEPVRRAERARRAHDGERPAHGSAQEHADRSTGRHCS